MTSNFAFMEERFPQLAAVGEQAEKYLYTDPNASLYKLGVIGEVVVAQCYAFDNIPKPYNGSMVDRINTLYNEGQIDSVVRDDLHTLRIVRNKAVHDGYQSVRKARELLETAYRLCEWVMITYGDFNYEHHKFVMPEKETYAEIAPVLIEEEEKADEKLVAEATEIAEKAPSVDLEERKKRAAKAASQRELSEAETRQLIDKQLRLAGWEADTDELRYTKGTAPQAGRNIAIAEWPVTLKDGKTGHVDYALFAGTKLVAISEAKAESMDVPSIIDYQCKEYAKGIQISESNAIGTWGEYRVPFTFSTNGRPYLKQLATKSGIWFLDLRESDNTPRALESWMRPQDLLEIAKRDAKPQPLIPAKQTDKVLTDPNGLNLRDYQIEAIAAAERAMEEGQDRILLAMATGTGKTRTVLGLIYRLLKQKRFRRILFLVDRNTLGEQAADAFRNVTLEDLLTLDKIYNVSDVTASAFDSDAKVQIATVQSMSRRLEYGEEKAGLVPMASDYDLVIVDEAHRGYTLSKEMSEDELQYRDQREYQGAFRRVMEYFDATKIALTATPALHTREIFGDAVFTYTYRQAVIDGYLVDHDAPHRLKTKLSSEGIHFQPGATVPVYDPITKEITNAELLEDELDYDIEAFNRRVITESFNRAVLTEIAKEIDPENPEIQGKTLIYAANDEHADIIVKILKEIYSKTGVSNDAIMKITASAGGGDRSRVQEAVNRFRNEKFPSIAVTVDLLTTGIDVPEITTLVFLRRVKSRILFEQMLGRATRLAPEINKDHFDIYDPVGVYESLESVNTMKPVVVDPGATFEQLTDGLAVLDDEAKVQNQVSEIVAKLQRKKRNMTQETLEQFKDMTGKTPDEFIEDVLDSNSKDAKELLLKNEAALKMVDRAKSEGRRRVVISDHEDELTSNEQEFGENMKTPEDYLAEFKDFVRSRKNQIDALNIICTRPKDLTRESLRSISLELAREGFSTQQLNTAVSSLTDAEVTADIISLIRRYAIGTPLLSHEERISGAVARLKKMHKFTKQQLTWIDRIEKYLASESVINVETFDEDLRFRNQGGFTKLNKTFGGELENIVQELNEYLYDEGGVTA